MRTSTILHILVILLVVSAAALIGYVSAVAHTLNPWLLYGVVFVLCVAILLLGGQIRITRLNEKRHTVEEQLAVAEARFQAFFNDPAVAIGILSLERTLVDANPTFFRILGYERDELIGKNAAVVTYPDDDPASAQLFRELLAGQRTAYESDRRYIRKNGEIFWAHVTMTIVRGSDNQPRYLVGVLLDIDQQKRDALALAESEARFRAAFESAAIGMAELSLDGRILKANAAICKMSGYTEDELKQRYDRQNVYPEDQDIGMDLFAELVNGARDHFQVERRYVRKNGDVFWTNLTLSAVRDPGGRLLYTVVLIEDVNEQKRAMEELRQSEARFQAAFESSAIGMALMTVDEHFLKANAAVRKISGYSEEELEKITASEILYSEDSSVGLDLFTEMMDGKRDHYQMERRYVRKNGEVFWASLTLSAVRDTQGNVAYLVALVEDIDEQKRTLAELKKSEARFQAVFENIAVGITILSLEGNILAGNPTVENIVGYTVEELRNMNPLDLMFEQDREVDTALYQDLIAGRRESFVSELQYYKKNGSLYWVRVNYSLVRDPEGTPDYLIALVENIDEEKRAAEKLAAQESEYRRMLEQRIAERTEELNQANQLIQQKAAQDAANSERTRLARDLHDAVTQTLFSASLIADVLPTIWEKNPGEGIKRTEELRQMTRGALAEMRMLLVELRPNALTEIPFPDLIRQLCESVIGRDRLPIQINLEGHGKLPALVQIGLYRIAQESLNNVVKHAKATQVVVTLRMGEQVRLVVADNGSGFDTSSVLLDHFGLQIMRERADSIGAQFSIYSEVDEGTQISVTWQEKQ